MFVSIVLNTEFFDYASRKMWFLKNLFHCKENGWVLITHEYIKNHFEELQDSISDRFLDEFEMRRFTLEEIRDVEQYYIPDTIFDTLEKKCGSRTDMLLELSTNTYPELEKYLQSIFDQIKEKHPSERIEGIFHCLEGYETLKRIANINNCPLIKYSFAAFRKPHGYRQTLYNVNIESDYWDSCESQKRYNHYLEENMGNIPVFTNEEIITIIGKEHTLPLIKLINSRPSHQIGVCCERYYITPPIFKKRRYTDDDIFYECRSLFKTSELKVRSHAGRLNEIHIDRSGIHNDPASFILSCKRIVAVQSQILLKSLLWKRTTIMKYDNLSFAFLCQRNLVSDEVANIRGLNYYIFCFLIPSELMFSDDYWKWRLTNPSETEIYWKHLNFLFSELGIDREKLLSLQGKDRYKYLLEARHCDKQLIDNLLSDEIVDNINWDVASSQFDVETLDGKKTYWRIDTENEDGSLTSKLSIDVDGATSVHFYPLYDVAGFAKLNEVKANGKKITLDQGMTTYKFMPKNKGCYELPMSETSGNHLEIECNWEYKGINEYLNS